jgi:nicotinamidase-related amidase
MEAMSQTPRRPRQALIILDMISEFDFSGWQQVLHEARRIAPAVARLRQRADRAGVPVIYVNDTGEEWESDQTAFLERCSAPDARGRDVAQRLRPRPRHYFIFKPRHSAFYATPLAPLLESMAIGEVMLAGMTSHQCVLFTAMDAHVRDFRIVVPSDCVGSPTRRQTSQALFMLREAVKARTPQAAAVRFAGRARRS